MLGNGIKQTTTTTGTGALTIAAVTGYPTLANVFAVGQPFSYTLLDSTGLFLEAGTGTLTSSTVMARSQVTATFAGTTYTKEGATASSLSGATTVICTPHAASMESMMPMVDSQSASINRWLTSAARATLNSGTALTALRVYYVPFLLRVGAPVISLSIAVLTAGAASTVARAGIYACNEKGYIGGLLATTGDLDTSATGNKTGTLTTPLFLPPGWYYTAVVGSGGPTIQGYTSNNAQVFGGAPVGYSTASPPVPIDFRFEALGSAVLLTAPSATTSSNIVGAVHTPLVYIGV